MWARDDLLGELLPQGEPDPVLIVHESIATDAIVLVAAALGRRVIATRHVPHGYVCAADANDFGYVE